MGKLAGNGLILEAASMMRKGGFRKVNSYGTKYSIMDQVKFVEDSL